MTEQELAEKYEFDYGWITVFEGTLDEARTVHSMWRGLNIKTDLICNGVVSIVRPLSVKDARLMSLKLDSISNVDNGNSDFVEYEHSFLED